MFSPLLALTRPIPTFTFRQISTLLELRFSTIPAKTSVSCLTPPLISHYPTIKRVHTPPTHHPTSPLLSTVSSTIGHHTSTPLPSMPHHLFKIHVVVVWFPTRHLLSQLLMMQCLTEGLKGCSSSPSYPGSIPRCRVEMYV